MWTVSTRSAPPPHSVITVCVIEDHDLFRAELEDCLSQAEGFECVGTFRDAETAHWSQQGE